jgi:hypothetical protein
MVVPHEGCALRPETYENKQKLLRGVQGGGFLEKNPPGRRRQKGIFTAGDYSLLLLGISSFNNRSTTFF